MKVNSSYGEVKLGSILEAILEDMATSPSVNAEGNASVVKKKEFLSKIKGKIAKDKIQKLLDKYDYVFSINAGEFKGDADKAQRQAADYFKKKFNAVPKIYKILVDKNYIVLIPVSFGISFENLEK